MTLAENDTDVRAHAFIGPKGAWDVHFFHT